MFGLMTSNRRGRVIGDLSGGGVGETKSEVKHEKFKLAKRHSWIPVRLDADGYPECQHIRPVERGRLENPTIAELCLQPAGVRISTVDGRHKSPG